MHAHTGTTGMSHPRTDLLTSLWWTCSVKLCERLWQWQSGRLSWQRIKEPACGKRQGGGRFGVAVGGGWGEVEMRNRKHSRWSWNKYKINLTAQTQRFYGFCSSGSRVLKCNLMLCLWWSSSSRLYQRSNMIFPSPALNYTTPSRSGYVFKVKVWSSDLSLTYCRLLLPLAQLTIKLIHKRRRHIFPPTQDKKYRTFSLAVNLIPAMTLTDLMRKGEMTPSQRCYCTHIDKFQHESTALDIWQDFQINLITYGWSIMIPAD